MKLDPKQFKAVAFLGPPDEYDYIGMGTIIVLKDFTEVLSIEPADHDSFPVMTLGWTDEFYEEHDIIYDGTSFYGLFKWKENGEYRLKVHSHLLVSDADKATLISTIEGWFNGRITTLSGA